ncbi:hypothetical protein ACE6H2_008323 [Prunus campanulata]
MRGSRSFRKLMNFLVMVQYVPRVLRIYLSCKKSKKPFKGQIALWVKATVVSNDAEILYLKPEVLKNFASNDNFVPHFSKIASELDLITSVRLTRLKKVERLKHMDEQVLKEISEHLRAEKYQDEYIIGLNELVEKMFFIVRGVVAVTNEYWTEYRNEVEHLNHSGDDLIDYWVRSKDTAFPKELPISALSFRAIGEVEVLVLMAKDLASVQPRRIHSKTFLLKNRSLQVGLN